MSPTARRVAVAWRHYLSATREAKPDAYDAVEALAWKRLRLDLAALGRPLPDPNGGPADDDETAEPD